MYNYFSFVSAIITSQREHCLGDPLHGRPSARMSLGDLLLYRLSISRRNAVCILFQVLCGLSHCHSNGVLHGNLTPMHIVVEPQVINEHIFMHTGALTTEDLDTYLSGATFKLTDFSRCRKLLFPPMRSKSHHSSTKVLSALHCTAHSSSTTTSLTVHTYNRTSYCSPCNTFRQRF